MNPTETVEAAVDAMLLIAPNLRRTAATVLARAALTFAGPIIRAQALEDAADEFEKRAKNVRNNTYLESPSCRSFVEHAENHERNADWLRLRAAAERASCMLNTKGEK